MDAAGGREPGPRPGGGLPGAALPADAAHDAPVRGRTAARGPAPGLPRRADLSAHSDPPPGAGRRVGASTRLCGGSGVSSAASEATWARPRAPRRAGRGRAPVRWRAPPGGSRTSPEPVAALAVAVGDPVGV